MILFFFSSKKKLDTIEDHHKKHTIEDQGCSWTTPLNNCLGAVFKLGFNKASYILGNYTFWEFQKNGAKKVKKREVLAKERERKGENDFVFFSSKKKLDTIEDHHKKHTIEDQGCSWTTPLNNCLGAVFKLGFNKASYILGNYIHILRIPKEWS